MGLVMIGSKACTPSKLHQAQETLSALWLNIYYTVRAWFLFDSHAFSTAVLEKRSNASEFQTDIWASTHASTKQGHYMHTSKENLKVDVALLMSTGALHTLLVSG